MKTTSKNNKMWKWVKKVLSIAVAILIMSVSVNMFLGPHSIAAGGLTGLSIILEQLLHLDRSVIILVGNVVVLACAFFFLGKEMFFNTVIGAALLPLIIGVVPHITLVQDTMLSMVMGSVLFGIAVTIMYHNKASSGGTAIPPLIFKKHFGLNTSLGLFVTDGIVVILSLIVFSVESFFYAVFSIFITSATMHYIESGINKKKMVYIISNQHESITHDILHEVERGVTIVPVIGAYKKNPMQMLLVTLSTRNYRQLLSIVNKHDKDAFMITDTVSDVHGQGFTYESGSV
ncbi:MAG: YitT family protein [Clostridiales bacterium]|nr:YitT family protein [Clostridiales bacterium]